MALALVSPANARRPDSGGVWGPPWPSPAHTDNNAYAPYLKDPAALGFSPDAALFEEIYSQIKSQHVEEDSDARLYEGVCTEVRLLLKEAHVTSDWLIDLKRDASLPQTIIRLYGARVPRKVLWYAMVRGLFTGTDDRHSVLMTPKEYERLTENLQDQTFGGIGVYVELDRDHKNQLTVIEPLEGTPACRAGILPGDRILSIDGHSTSGMSMDMASTYMRGKVGTRVALEVRRGGKLREFSIERASIQVPSVAHKMLPNNVGYIRLRVYGDRTGSEFKEAVTECERSGAQSLVIDIRNNTGGYLSAAIDLCSHFIPSGDLVTYLTARHGVRRDYRGESIHRTRLPIVLLVNGYSASASEVTAGCLKDYHVATLIGSRTYGKGSVQKLFKLRDGAAFKLTVAYFFTPRGSRINKVGVEPDLKVDMEPRWVGHPIDKDVQLQRALQYLSSKTSHR